MNAGHDPCHDVLTSMLALSFTGMVIRPKADETFEIVYDVERTESWDMYAQALDKFLARKSDSPSYSDLKSLLLWLIRRARVNCFYGIRDHSFTVSE